MSKDKDWADIIDGTEQGNIVDAETLCRLLSDRFRMISIRSPLPKHIGVMFGSVASDLNGMREYLAGFKAAR